MKCLTLTQPWATLVALGAKHIETRNWETLYRGPLAIHAAKGYGKGGKRGFHARCQYEPFLSALEPHLRIFGHYNCFAAPLGAIVATCELRDCVRTQYVVDAGRCTSVSWESGERTIWTLTAQERAFGNYEPGRFAWLLANIRALPEPIPCKGALGLWNYEGAL